MSTKRAKPKTVPLPTKEELLTYIRESPNPVGKRDLARAFRISGSNRIQLKAMLKELQQEGALGRDRGRRFGSAGRLPEVTLVEVTGTDEDGEVLARPLAWSADGPPPRIYMAPDRRGTPALGPGDRLLARLRAIGPGQYEGRTIRRISEAPGKVLGVYVLAPDGGRIRPTDRRLKAEYAVARGAVERVSRAHIVGHVGDGDEQVPASGIRRIGVGLGPHGIVEVACVLAVDGDKRNRAQIDAAVEPDRLCCCRLRERIAREVDRDAAAGDGNQAD